MATPPPPASLALHKSVPVESSTLEILFAEIARSTDETQSESIGKTVGFKYASRLLPGPGGFAKPLEVFKFVCKDVWLELYGKKMDRLQTNHRGVFMLTDLAFPPLAHASKGTGEEKGTAIHRGFLLGLLSGFGVLVESVSCESLASANEHGVGLGCVFTVTTTPQPTQTGLAP